MWLWIEAYLLPCAYKQLLGIECPFCGSQRSLVLLLQGRLEESLRMYPPLIPVLVLAVLFGLHLVKRNLVSRPVLTRFALIVLAIVMVNYFGNALSGKL